MIQIQVVGSARPFEAFVGRAIAAITITQVAALDIGGDSLPLVKESVIPLRSFRVEGIIRAMVAHMRKSLHVSCTHNHHIVVCRRSTLPSTSGNNHWCHRFHYLNVCIVIVIAVVYSTDGRRLALDFLSRVVDHCWWFLLNYYYIVIFVVFVIVVGRIDPNYFMR